MDFAPSIDMDQKASMLDLDLTMGTQDHGGRLQHLQQFLKVYGKYIKKSCTLEIAIEELWKWLTK